MWRSLNLGVGFISPAVVGLFLGGFLDDKFASYPVLTVSLLILGILTGLWSIYKEIKNAA